MQRRNTKGEDYFTTDEADWFVVQIQLADNTGYRTIEEGTYDECAACIQDNIQYGTKHSYRILHVTAKAVEYVEPESSASKLAKLKRQLLQIHKDLLFSEFDESISKQFPEMIEQIDQVIVRVKNHEIQN